jgi:hypothetical protein
MVKIRITSKDKTEYNKLKNKVKSKIARTSKKYGVNLISEIDIPDLSEFKTRKEYNEWKEKASSFTNRNNRRYQYRRNEKGFVYNIAEHEKAKRHYDRGVRLAKERKKKIENLELKFNGKTIGKVKDREVLFSHPESVNFPEPYDINKIHDRKHFERRLAQYEKRSSPNFFRDTDKRMQDNFIKSVEGSFDSSSFVDSVIDKIRSLPPDVFYELYKQNFNEFDFTLYDSEGHFASANLSQLVAIDHIINEWVDGDNEDIELLKDFPDRL